MVTLELAEGILAGPDSCVLISPRSSAKRLRRLGKRIPRVSRGWTPKSPPAISLRRKLAASEITCRHARLVGIVVTAPAGTPHVFGLGTH